MFLRQSLYWLNYFVVRWQLILTLIVLWWAGGWLRTHYGQDDSNSWIVMYIFIRILQWTIVGLFAASLLLAVAAWLFSLLNIRSRRINVQVQIGDGHRAEAGFVPLTIALTGAVVRPLLGTIRARLVFGGKRLSESVLLDTDIHRRRAIIRSGIRGSGKTLLHDRGIYDVEKVLICFCDMFNLVALPVSMPLTAQLYTLPKEQSRDEVKAQPHTTEEQKHRIDIPKRVEGEYINYKEFETGDNIRRIVWQIYAKSGQLVVRIPEIKDPYASHLYFYVSFFEGLDVQGSLFDTELLNVYKDKIRNLFEALLENGFAVRLPQDQEVPKLQGQGDKKMELFQISAAQWQHALTPAAFVAPSKAAFVCLTSASPVSEIELMLRNLHPSVPVVIVRMSNAIPSPFEIRLNDIFFRPAPQPYDRLRKPWLLSPLRKRLLKNEEAIRESLKHRENSWLVDAIDTTE